MATTLNEKTPVSDKENTPVSVLERKNTENVPSFLPTFDNKHDKEEAQNNPYVNTLSNLDWIRLNYFLKNFLEKNKGNSEVSGMLKVLLNSNSTQKNINNVIDQLCALKKQNETSTEKNMAILYLWGICHFYGLGVKHDQCLGLESIIEAAQKEYPPALFHLAFCYQDGIGVSKDIKKSFELYQVASEKYQYAPAQTNLALFYHESNNDHIVKQDMKKFEELTELAVKQEYAPAQNNLAQKYAVLFHEAVKRNDEACKKQFYEKYEFLKFHAAAEGYVLALESLKRENADECFVQKSIQIYQKLHPSLSHDQYQAIGLYILCSYYQRQNIDNMSEYERKALAKKYLLEAAALGHPLACAEIAKNAFNNKDYKTAVEGFTVALKYGQPCEHELAASYYHADDVVDHFEKSAMLYFWLWNERRFDWVRSFETFETISGKIVQLAAIIGIISEDPSLSLNMLPTSPNERRMNDHEERVYSNQKLENYLNKRDLLNKAFARFDTQVHCPKAKAILKFCQEIGISPMSKDKVNIKNVKY